MSKKYDVCILGVTGAVGEAMLSILEQRKFPVGNLYPLASSRSAGSKVTFHGKEMTVLVARVSDAWSVRVAELMMAPGGRKEAMSNSMRPRRRELLG